MLTYLACSAQRPVASAEIASSVDTNPVVVRRLLAALARAGLVRAQKGAAGGFTLAKPPRDIPLLAIYHVVEPRPDTGMRHFAPNRRCPVGARIEAVLEGFLTRAHAGMEAELARATLADVRDQLDRAAPPLRPAE